MKSLSVVTILSAVLIAAGCDRDDSVRAYQAPKDAAPSALAMAGPESGAGASTNTPSAAGAAQQAGEPIAWDVPAGWKPLPGSQMRYASFQVLPDDPQLQLTVIPLGPENTLLPN